MLLQNSLKNVYFFLINLRLQFRIHWNIYQLSTKQILNSYKTFQVEI